MRRDIGRINTIANKGVWSNTETRTEDAAPHDTGSDIHDVIGQTTSIREPRGVTCDESQTATSGNRRRRYAGIQSQQICDRAGGCALRSDWRRIRYQGQ